MSLLEKIQSRMEELGISPKRSLGQNFLISDHVVEKIVEAAAPSSFDQVVEVGPGLGALTDLLFQANNNLDLIELDKNFAEYWRQMGKRVHEVDALKFSWKDLSFQNQSHLLVSNLPYQISSRLVVDLSLLEPSFSRMVLMFQKEVAQRIVASPGTAEYGLLTVVAQSFWHIHMVLEAGAVDFLPKPNVASRVLCFDQKKERPKGLGEGFFSFVKVAFANRRKKLLPKLTGFKSRDQLAILFKSQGLAEDIRAEKLSPKEFLELYLALKTG